MTAAASAHPYDALTPDVVLDALASIGIEGSNEAPVPVQALSPTGQTDVALVLRDSASEFDGAALLLPSTEASRARESAVIGCASSHARARTRR